MHNSVCTSPKIGLLWILNWMCTLWDGVTVCVCLSHCSRRLSKCVTCTNFVCWKWSNYLDSLFVYAPMVLRNRFSFFFFFAVDLVVLGCRKQRQINSISSVEWEMQQLKCLFFFWNNNSKKCTHRQRALYFVRLKFFISLCIFPAGQR